MQQRSKPQKNAPLVLSSSCSSSCCSYSAAATVLSVNNMGYAPYPWLLSGTAVWIRSTSSCSARASFWLIGFSALRWRGSSMAFTSYPLKVSSMPSCLYDSMLTETMRRQNAKGRRRGDQRLFVRLQSDETDTGLHNGSINIPMSRNKVQTITNCVPKDQQSSHFFPHGKVPRHPDRADVWGGLLKIS